jgi:hypothetical protein
MDEAKRAGHDTVVEYLEALSTKQQVARALDKYAAQQAHALVLAAYKGDLPAVQQLLADNVLPDSSSYDGKTALQVRSGKQT